MISSLPHASSPWRWQCCLTAVAFFAASGANIATIELVDRYILPRANGREEQLGARILLAIIYLSIVFSRRFFPWVAAALSTLALPLSAQCFRPISVVCWVPWMSCSAVLVGLISAACPSCLPSRRLDRLRRPVALAALGPLAADDPLGGLGIARQCCRRVCWLRYSLSGCGA